MVEYREIFLDEIKALLPYFVEFSENRSILSKDYPKDCAVSRLNKRLIIMIIYNKNTFLANDRWQKIWTQDGHAILWLKDRGKGIMVSDFLPLWSRLNLFSLSFKKQDRLVSLGVLLEAVTYFEYRKIEEKYWISEHFLNQIQKKALPIRKALYPGYTLLFIFDNATSHLIYAKNALQVANMNKSLKGQQAFLQPR